MMMVTYTRDREKVRAKGQELPLSEKLAHICCDNDSEVVFKAGVLRVKGKDIDYRMGEVSYVSATIVNDK